MKDINKMVQELLDMDIVNEKNEIVFSKESKNLIHDIAKECQKIPLVQESREQAERYAESLSAEQLYIDMMCKIVDAPTSIYMIMSARILIPVIDRKLRKEE